jgi:hypothetical protein
MSCLFLSVQRYKNSDKTGVAQILQDYMRNYAPEARPSAVCIDIAGPVGKDHGIMLGTLVTPEGKQYVIKNGRKLGKWGYKENYLDLFIHTHRLTGHGDKYTVHLENTMATANLELKSSIAPFDHNSYSSADGFIETSFYAPSLEGVGNWQLGPEAGFDPPGPVHNITKAEGFGVHVLMTDKVDKLISNWTRVIGVGTSDAKPFLSAITRPDGSEDIILKLIDGNAVLDQFSNIDIKYKDMKKDKDTSYPMEIELSATSDKGTISGSIKNKKKLSHFNLKDEQNFLERSFAKSNPSVINFRYSADYELVYKTEAGEKVLSGKALGEYTDVVAAKKAPAKRRRNRR